MNIRRSMWIGFISAAVIAAMLQAVVLVLMASGLSPVFSVSEVVIGIFEVVVISVVFGAIGAAIGAGICAVSEAVGRKGA